MRIGVDVGGTKVAAGVVDDDGHILSRRRRDTPAQDPAATEDVIADCIQALAAQHQVEAAGLGAAGFVDAARSTVLFAPNLAWRNEPLRAAVEQRTGLPVVVENDANAAAWAETRFGAGHGQPHTVTLTVGTGLGGGVVLGGELVRGAFGAAAEVGHLTLVPTAAPAAAATPAAGSSTPAAAPWSPRPANGPPAPPPRPACSWSWPTARPTPSPAPW